MIGLIGGMSWESSAEYYRLANELTRQRRGGLHSAACILYSVDFAEIAAMQKQGNWQGAGEALGVAAAALERAGASVVLVCTNTMHKVVAHVESAVSIPVLDIRDVTAGAVKAAQVQTVGLLATAYTMEQSFYVERLQSHGLSVITPPPDDRSEVHRIIYEELCVGEVRDESRQVYVEVIERLRDAGCEGVILGCTEIELLIKQQDSPLPVFPTTRLHVDAALQWSATA